jgi:hypothetical protein
MNAKYGANHPDQAASALAGSPKSYCAGELSAMITGRAFATAMSRNASVRAYGVASPRPGCVSGPEKSFALNRSIENQSMTAAPGNQRYSPLAFVSAKSPGAAGS